MTPQHQIAKIESVKVWVTRLPSLSHLPLSMWRHRVTCLPPKNASAPWGGPGSRWLLIIIWQVSYIQYLLACQKSQRSTPYNIVKSGLPWKRVFRRRHLGRRVTAVTCLRWPTMLVPMWISGCSPVQFQWLWGGGPVSMVVGWRASFNGCGVEGQFQWLWGGGPVSMVVGWRASFNGCGVEGQFQWLWGGGPVSMAVGWRASFNGCGVEGQFQWLWGGGTVSMVVGWRASFNGCGVEGQFQWLLGGGLAPGRQEVVYLSCSPPPCQLS